MREIKLIFQTQPNKIQYDYYIQDDVFFEKIENKINFQSDIRCLPTLRNDLVFKNKLGDKPHDAFSISDKLEILINQNSFDKTTNFYINNIKRKYQIEKDIVDMAYRNKLKDPAEFKIEATFKRLKEEMNAKLYDSNSYEINSYFNNKYEIYDKVKFSETRAKDIILSIKINETIDKPRTVKRLFSTMMRKSINNKIDNLENHLNIFMKERTLETPNVYEKFQNFNK